MPGSGLAFWHCSKPTFLMASTGQKTSQINAGDFASVASAGATSEDSRTKAHGLPLAGS